jgi:hypothetical protein
MNKENPSLGEVTRGDIVNVRFNKWGVGPSNARGVVIRNYETPVPFHVRKIWFHRGGTGIKGPVYEINVHGQGESPRLEKSTAPITVQEAARRVVTDKSASFVWEQLSEPDGPIQIDVTPRETTSVYTVAYSGND